MPRKAAEGKMAEETKDTAGTQESKPPKPVKKNPIEDRLRAAFGDSAEMTYNLQGELEIRVPSTKIIALCDALLKNEQAPYDYLRNQTAVDWKDRIEIVYNICSTRTRESVVVKTNLDRETPWIETVTNIWPAADWLEREIFDLFGVSFGGHPDLRRIMLTDD